MDPEELRKRILAKYPTATTEDGIKYYDLSADELARRVVAKYPKGVTSDGIPYANFLKKDDRNFFEKVSDTMIKVENAVGEFTGAKTLIEKGVGEIARRLPGDSALERGAEATTLPTTGQTAGAALKLGSFFIPGSTVVRLAATGYAQSAGSQLEEGKGIKSLYSPETVATTALSVAIPKAVQLGISKLYAPAIERLSGLSDDALSRVFKNADSPQMLGKILKEEKVIPEGYTNVRDYGFKGFVRDLVGGVRRGEGGGYTAFRAAMGAVKSIGLFIHPSIPAAVSATDIATAPIINVKAAIALGKLAPYWNDFNQVARNAILSTIDSFNE
jgi:hypothetical protein